MVCPLASCTTSGRDPVGDLQKQQFPSSWVIAVPLRPSSSSSSRAEAGMNSAAWIRAP